MGIRTRVVLTVWGTMLLLFVALAMGASVLLARRSAESQEAEAAAVAQRVADAFASDAEQLRALATLLAANDSTYRAVVEQPSAPFGTTFSELALLRQGASFLVVLDEDGRFTYGIAADPDLETRVPLAAGTARTLEAERTLVAPGDPHGQANAVLKLPGGVALVASHAITSDDMYAEPRGTVVVGRYVDASEVERLSSATGVELSAHESAGIRPSAPSSFEPRYVLGGSSTWSIPTAGGSLVYIDFDDPSGQSVVTLGFELREDSAGLRGSIALVSVLLLVLCVAASVVVLKAADVVVIGPLSDLSRQVEAIGRSEDGSERVSVSGTGEIERLADSVNHMLKSLAAARERLADANEELEERVHERTVELTVSESRHRSMIERLADAVFIVNRDGTILLVNEAAVELTGLERVELLGARFAELMSPGTAEGLHDYLTNMPADDETWTVEASLASKARGAVPVEMRATSYEHLDGEPAGTQWIARDMTERLRYESQLLHLATHDALTGLANRHSFEQALEQDVARALREGGGGAVVWLDLDDFKDVNDTLGHAAGDEVLSMLASLLLRNMRGIDMIARVGGDEFAVLMPGVNRQEAEGAAQRLLTSVTTHTLVVRDRTLRVGASFGVIMYPESGTSAQELLSNADAAMYRAKEGGRSMVWVSDQDGSPGRLHVSRIEWNARISSALESGSFSVFAQPIVDVSTGEVARHELLVRMNRAEGGLYPPSDFLPVAERLGLIVEIDRWMLRAALRLLASDSLGGVEVNLSAKALADRDFVAFVAAELDQAEVAPNRLGFEITETATIADLSRAQWFIGELKRFGCRFSLDDFGTGYSSFAYLKHLPVDCLKIDGMYVRELARNRQDRCLVSGMREICRGLGVEVLAECVEDAQTFEVVRALDIDFAQGFYLGRPEPIRLPESDVSV